MNKAKLIEEIETKIEEWMEAIAVTRDSKYSFLVNTEHHEGIVVGLELAKSIIEEHDGS
jgi:hypothetical protein